MVIQSQHEFKTPYCNKILNHLTALREIVPDSHQDFVDSLQALKNVKDACFGTKQSFNS